MSWTKIETSALSTQVTCLKFVHSFVLVGEGSWLSAYRGTDGNYSMKARIRVFDSNNVHGIEPRPYENGPNTKLCVFGGRVLRILLMKETHNPELSAISEPITFQDWIWDVKWFNDDYIGLVLSQNYSVLFSTVQNKVKEVCPCEEKCILYCGILVGSCWSDVAVFAGTVFQQILVWRPSGQKDERVKAGRVLHRLTGHDGVIFSIYYDHSIRKLCACSDDRSIQIWNHGQPSDSGVQTGVEISSPKSIDWSLSTFSLLCKLYGHESRVWKVVNFGSTFVSAGEDSQLCFWTKHDVDDTWSLDRKVTCHGQSSIRSLDVDQDKKFLVTGGGNGEVKLWCVGSDVDADTAHSHIDIAKVTNLSDGYRELLAKDYPRETKMLNFNSMLIVTNEGAFFCHDLLASQTTFLTQEDKFRSFCVIDVEADDDTDDAILCAGDLFGGVTFFRAGHDNSKNSFIKLGDVQVFDGKVMALKLLRNGVKSYVLVCGPEGKMVLYEIQVTESLVYTEQVCILQLLPYRQRWFTAAALLRCGEHGITVICGGRNGSIHVFHADSPGQKSDSCDLVQSFHRIHGANGVTDIAWLESSSIVRTTGRDGFIRSLEEVSNGNFRLLNKTRISGCPKWISGLRTVDKDTLILGFHTDNFVVWSETNNSTLLQLPCGGGHRAWDFKIAAGEIRFCYIKDRTVAYYSVCVGLSRPRCIKPGFHHRQICSIHHLLTNGTRTFLATGSEDNTAHIVQVARSICALERHTTVRRVAVLGSHISSVKSVTSCSWQNVPDDRLVVTVGGRAQLVCWRFHPTNKRFHGEVRIQELVSHMLHPEGRRSKKPWKQSTYTFDPETRYMDASVWSLDDPDGLIYVIAVACSDSFVRIFTLDVISLKVVLIMEDPIHGHCVLKVREVRIRSRRLLLTSATDGCVLFWDMTGIELRDVDDDATSPLVFRTRPHQSGVTAIEAIVLESPNDRTRLVVATGGDDTDVVLTVLDVDCDPAGRLKLTDICRTSVEANHTAQVTGIYMTPTCLWTASIDHRVTGWRYELRPLMDKIALEQIVYQISNVSDISSMAGFMWTTLCDCAEDNGLSLIVVGQGMEVFDPISVRDTKTLKEIKCDHPENVVVEKKNR